jgi:hypothetical protein
MDLPVRRQAPPALGILGEQIRQEFLRYAKIGFRQTFQSSGKIQKLADGGGPEHAKGSRVRDTTAIRLSASSSIINQQQHVRLLLCEKNRGAFARIDLLQGGVIFESYELASPEAIPDATESNSTPLAA